MHPTIDRLQSLQAGLETGSTVLIQFVLWSCCAKLSVSFMHWNVSLISSSSSLPSQRAVNWILIPCTQSQPVNKVENRERYREHVPAAFVGKHAKIGFLSVCRLGTSHTTRDQIVFTRRFFFRFVSLLADQMNLAIGISNVVWLEAMLTLEHYLVVLRLGNERKFNYH